MKKIICIGECSLDIVFDGAKQPIGSMPGGRIVNAAAMLARSGLSTYFMGDAAADAVGDTVVHYLATAGVDTHSIDRITEGRTPVMIYMPGADGSMTVTRYEDYPEETFDVVWPRIEAGDVVVFGGYYVIDPRSRRRMSQLLRHCAEIKAILIYLPGYPSEQQPRITKVMPAILEGIEMADIVMTRNRDLQHIFGTDQGDRCYRDHIDFYCRSLINIDIQCTRIDYFSGQEVTSANIPVPTAASLIWNAGAVAGVVQAICAGQISKEALETPSDALRRQILTAAVETANAQVAALDADWKSTH